MAVGADDPATAGGGPPPDDRPSNPLSALAAQAGQRLQSQALAGLLAAFEHLLDQQPWAREKLRPHAGAVLRLGIQGDATRRFPAPEVYLQISERGGLAAVAPQTEVRASLLLEPSAQALGALLRSGPDGLSRHLRVEGDAMLAACLGDLARHLRWEAEEDLSRVVGDVLAHRAVGFLRAGMAQLRRFGEQPLDSAGRFAAAGGAPVVPRSALAELNDAFRALDQRLAGLESRAARLGLAG